MAIDDLQLHLLPLVSIFPCFILLAAIFFCTFILAPGGIAWAAAHALSSKSKTVNSHIPGPTGLPIVGLVFAFTGSNTHRVLASLARSFHAERLMAFSVGFTRFVVSSSPDTAREILASADFADRPVKESAYELMFHRAIGFAPYGEYWRSLRRISTTHLFSPRMISSFGAFRQDIAEEMAYGIRAQIRRSCDGTVRVRRALHLASLNNVMMSVFGKRFDFFNPEADLAAKELEWLVREGYELLGVFNWSDHFPGLSFLDLQGVRKRCKKLVHKVNVFVKDLIEEHRVRKTEEHGIGDFVDVLLNLENENRLSGSDMIAILWEMIFRGTDTVAILLEWILARMVVHQDIQAKAQAEIDDIVGPENISITHEHLPNLTYLNAIIKETLRMHPPGPLLSWARLAIQDTYIGPHFIPAGTTAMVNMWSITHDGSIWSNPDDFKPERFLSDGKDVGVMGSDLRLAPFGSGRRVCLGKAMGYATVQLWLAHLLQNFKWEAASHEGVDLSECLKLSLEMKNSLVCKVIPRISCASSKFPEATQSS